MEDKSSVIIFVDDDPQPVGSFKSPINFGKEGIRKIPFVVRNGPDITIEGLKENEVVDGVIPLMVSAYGKGDQKVFLIEGSETPRSIPGWVWVLHILFGGWALYYLFTQIAIT